MALFVIYGPPNSGRTGKLQREYVDLLPNDPVLVVPSVDDIFTWERRLSRDTGAFVGARIVHFKDLCRRILELEGTPGPPVASELQRRRLVRAAIGAEWPELATRLRDQPGLVAAALDMLDDFRANLLDPDSLELRVRESGVRRLELLLLVYRDYLRRLTAAGFTDWPENYLRATKADLSGWRGIPVFVAGFDDLTHQQLELLLRLAGQTDVTVAVTHEIGNPAMALTATLLADLLENGASVKAETARAPEARDHHPQLFEVERRFMRPRHEERLSPGDAVRVMRSSGRRNEAEAVAARIAGLVDSGTPPGEIAIAIDDPRHGGPLFRDVLTGYDLPVTLESETVAADTATGASVLALLAATGERGTAADLLRFLRGPAGPDPEMVDELERAIARGGIESAEAAIGALAEAGGQAPWWTELNAAGDDGKAIAELVAGFATEIAAGILDRDPGPVPRGITLAETQAATAIARACAELVKVGGDSLPRTAIEEAISSDAVKVWAIPTEDTIRIASPYSLRAKRVQYLFYVSLQEGGIVDSDRSGPFLSAPERSTLALPKYADPEVQARYLFYSCLSVPTKGLWLSCRVADETGKAEYPSPLLGSVEDLFEDGRVNPEGVPAGKTGSEITFRASQAPSLGELARAVAAVPEGQEGLLLAGLEPSAADLVWDRVAAARRAEVRGRRIRSLESPDVLAEIAAEGLFSATAVEAYAGCPYRWFIDRQLKPERFGPDPDYLAFGNLLHETLAALYSARPGGIARDDDLDEWLEAVGPEVERQANNPRIRLGSRSPQHRGLRSRARELISAHLLREAARESPAFTPSFVEVDFGPEGASGPVPMDGWGLVGKVDRIDTSGEEGVGLGRRGMVIDYKSGSTSTLAVKDIVKKRRLQLQLYMHAIAVNLGIEPVAGFYLPLTAGDGRPRGPFDKTVAGDFEDLHPYGNDGSTDLRGFIDEGVRLADRSAREMMAGLLTHDPTTCPDHYDHPAVPDRGIIDEDDAVPGRVIR